MLCLLGEISVQHLRKRAEDAHYAVMGTVSTSRLVHFCSYQDLCVLHEEISPFPNPSYRENILVCHDLSCCSRCLGCLLECHKFILKR